MFKAISVGKLLNRGGLLKNMGPVRIWRGVHRRLSYLLKGSIYPIAIPSVEIQPGLDFLVLQLPSRYQPMMPNGLGYVFSILRNCGIVFQVIDANIIFYHRYHSGRILGGTNPVIAPSGYVMKEDPWSQSNAREWDKKEVIEYFWPYIEEMLQRIETNRPKAIGLSINETNRTLSNKFISALRARVPETAIVVGGYDCVHHRSGPYLVPDFDYMVIGEAELTLDRLVRALSRGERPKDMIGVMSRYDSPGRKWVEPPLPEDLDSVGFPTYEWTDLALYTTFDWGRFAPITASRGCNWGRCRFCAECFPFRKRLPQKVADEIEFMVSRGFYNLHFNESDVNGDPENLYNICSEIIRRGIKASFVGQLRIDRHNTKDYFRHLARAGFVHLRFGVDGWTDNTLRLQRKGYGMDLVFRNLRDCYETGIYTAVNIVIGVPGETEDDIDETIGNIIKCKDHIDSVVSFNTLILAAGSEYYRNPDHYKIRFRRGKDEIYRDYPHCIPNDLWYSDDPYIDQEIRTKRFNRTAAGLHKHGIGIGPFAAVVADNHRKEQEKAGVR